MIAPLSDDTLVIGTNDSGRTIHSEFDAPEDTRDSIRAFARVRSGTKASWSDP